MAVIPDQALEEEEAHSGRQSHTYNLLKKSETESDRETLMAPSYPFYKPQAKGRAGTGKRHAVAQILLLDWATVALAMPWKALGRKPAQMPLSFGTAQSS